ncbi:POZ domain-containing protein [Leucosporidium creatinivorum]|uniref:Elongin-C n=1 Tax=Leucosporidium creatinivorum TaxID=106004 RepID=A0A1Y2FXH5_9BASI|nr:POZ domain-containing protein [Leucosporidium creatinivorum]
MAENPWVTLISADGHRFVLPRAAALGSVLISDSLTSGMGGFAEAQKGIINLEEQRAEVVEKVAEYLMFKERYTNSKDEIPEFKDRVKPEIALELLMASDFMQC